MSAAIVAKCCAAGESFDASGKCSLDANALTVGRLDNFDSVLFSPDLAPACERMDNEQYVLLNNGSLIADGALAVNGTYCFDLYRGVLTAFTCVPPEDKDVDGELQYRLYPVGMLISLPFFAATLFVYALLPALHRPLNGKCIMSYLVAMIVAYSSLAVLQLATDSLSNTGCISLGYVMQFGFLATFFWLNIMCFDIWWTFSSLKKAGTGGKERDRRKFILYSLYAWGVPLVILSITLTMDFGNLLPADHILRPGMGKMKCFFENAEATWLYLYGPMGLIIVSNLIMFGITAKRIFLHSKETKVLRSEDSQRHDSKDRERFNLYLKLFVVMGINWVAELISWTFNSPSSIWYLTDITNTLQGVIIFIIFVCKRRVLRMVEARLCPARARRRQIALTSARSRLTTSSTAPPVSTPATSERLKLNDISNNSDAKT